MSIRFDCPSCAKKLVMPDRFEGRSVRCPTCEIKLTVPKKATDDSEKEAEKEVEKERAIAPDKMPSRITPSTLGELSTREPFEPSRVAKQEPTTQVPEPKRARRALHAKDRDEENNLEWDITPMVDVAFLLLIFFMLTASFSIQKVIRTSPQQTESPSNSTKTVVEESTDKLIIQVDEFSAYTVISPHGGTQEASSRQDLIVILKDLRVQYGEQAPSVVIQAHEDSTHGAVVGGMDAAREADFARFQLVVVEDFDLARS